jgi:hypothetical protein
MTELAIWIKAERMEKTCRRVDIYIFWKGVIVNG